MTFDLVQRAVRSLALDAATESHSHRIACMATALGLRLDLGDEELAALHFGAYLHDVGKVGVSDALLLKPGPLTRDEYAVVKQHAVLGDRLCAALGAASMAREVVRHHHERLDGSGYPDGLAGGQISMLARIVAIADVFDALTTDRPYRARVMPAQALAYLRVEARLGRLDRLLVDEFISLVGGRLGAAAPIALLAS